MHQGSCHRSTLRQGETYRERMYLISDKLTELDAKSKTWVSQRMRDKVASTANGSESESGISNGQSVVLFKEELGDASDSSSTSNTVFGGCLGQENCGQDAIDDVVSCQGWTTPKPGYLATFAIQCGDTHYVGVDRYHFSDYKDGGIYHHNHVCNNDVDASDGTDAPTFHLLGYFEEGDCIGAFASDEYDQQLCSPTFSIA
jgi:hypothetical protein